MMASSLDLCRLLLRKLFFVAFTLTILHASHCSCCHALSISSLNAHTKPEEIVAAQLLALQEDDMQRVYDFASPNNKASVQNDLNVFAKMVRQTPQYAPLIKHENAQLLLTTTKTKKRSFDASDYVLWQGLVRVVPTIHTTSSLSRRMNENNKNEDDDDDEEEEDLPQKEKPQNIMVVEYWWTLSRWSAQRMLPGGCRHARQLMFDRISVKRQS